METPCCSASSQVWNMVRALPACAPQAMFADVIKAISSASWPAPSPMSQFRSTRNIHPF